MPEECPICGDEHCVYVTCPECRGEGFEDFHDPNTACSLCGGSGDVCPTLVIRDDYDRSEHLGL